MTVVSAAVEADGWTLAVTYSAAAPSTRADFALFSGTGPVSNQSEANARVIATVSGPGFNRTGVQAVAATRSRPVVAHDVAYGRYPDWEAGQPVSAQPDFTGAGFPHFAPANRLLGEVDNGNGTRTIRLMLHKPVAPGETVSVLFRAGWRPGTATDQTIAATNNSTVALEIPSARWATVPYEAIRGTPTEPANGAVIDVLASHILPEGKSGVAGVRVIATDGTSRSVASWLSIGTSTRYGDSVRCWTGAVSFEIDGAPGTYLNAGLIALHWTVYPWFGAPRHSSGANDPATAAPSTLHPGTASGNESMRAEAERALMLAYDRTGTRYGYTTQAVPGGGTNPLGHAASTYYRYACVVVDPAGGRTTNPANRNEAEQVVGLGNTPAEARANALTLPVGSRCQNQVVAGAALTRLGRGLDNANGYTATKTNAHDGFEMHFIAGTHDWSTASVLAGSSSTETHLVWTGAGIGSTIIRGAASGTHNAGGATRVRYRDCRFRMRASGFPTGGAAVFWLDNVELIDDDPGTPATVFGINPPAAGLTWLHATNVTEDYVGTASWQNLSASALMVRSVSSRKGFASPVVVRCTRTGAGLTNIQLSAPALAAGGADGCRQDMHWWNNDLRATNAASGWAFQPVTYTGGDGRLKCVRMNVINNVMEKSGGGSAPAWALGEINTTEIDVSGCIIEHNTVVGDRANHFYNQPAPVDIAGSFSRFNSYRHNRVANNYFDKLVHKGECLFDSSTATTRASLGEPAATRGYRGHLTQGRQIAFGHLYEGNVDGWRTFIGSQQGGCPENWGLNARVSATPWVSGGRPAGNLAWPGFTAPASVSDGGGGGGDYRPASGSPLLGLATSAQIDVDCRGTLRTGAAWTAGAFDAEPSATNLGPAGARHAHRAAATALAFGAGLVAASARHLVRSLGALLGHAPGGGPGAGSARVRRVPRDERRARPDRD